LETIFFNTFPIGEQNKLRPIIVGAMAALPDRGELPWTDPAGPGGTPAPEPLAPTAFRMCVSAEKQQEVVLVESVSSLLHAACRAQQLDVGIPIATGKRKTRVNRIVGAISYDGISNPREGSGP
jgi:hypothetical protein